MFNKKTLRVGIGAVLFIILTVVSWQVFITPTEGENLSEKEAKEIVLERFHGDITDLNYTNGEYKMKLNSDTGEYEVNVSKESGEITDIVRTKKEEPVENLTEKEIKDIIAKEEKGKLEELNSRGKDKRLFYDAIVKNKDTEVRLTLKGEDGKIVKRNEKQLKKTQEEKETASSKEENKEQNQQSNQDEKSSSQSQENNHNNDQQTQTESEPPKNISKQEAIEIALNTYYGEVDDVDLETENGQLYYFIEIENDAEDMEADIQINAITGEVVSIEWDD